MKKNCEDWLQSQFGDDRETIEAIYTEYLETMRGLEPTLEAAIAGGDAAALDRVLHTIKGTAAMAGDAELSALAQNARSEGAEVTPDRVLAEMRLLRT